MKLNVAFLATAAAVVSLSANGAQASSAISLVTIGQEYSGSQYTLGFEFSVLDAQFVTALGAYDSGKDGLNGRAFVGLWDTAGNLLTSTIVGAGTSGTLDGRFRHSAITPYALVVGQHYIVGAFEPGDLASSWGTGQGGTAALNLHMNYYGDRFSNFNSAFSFPDTTNGTGGAWLGGNLLISSGAVPEPAAWALMIMGFGLAGASLRRRRGLAA